MLVEVRRCRFIASELPPDEFARLDCTRGVPFSPEVTAFEDDRGRVVEDAIFVRPEPFRELLLGAPEARFLFMTNEKALSGKRR